MITLPVRTSSAPGATVPRPPEPGPLPEPEPTDSRPRAVAADPAGTAAPPSRDDSITVGAPPAEIRPFAT
jgi:hypothetical protein